jgi:hypothetical protein
VGRILLLPIEGNDMHKLIGHAVIGSLNPMLSVFIILMVSGWFRSPKARKGVVLIVAILIATAVLWVICNLFMQANMLQWPPPLEHP